MFWENKLEELGKLAPVVLQMHNRGSWSAQILANIRIDDSTEVEMAPSAAGSTPAGCVDALWKKLAADFKPIMLYEPGKPVRRVRFNARWEDIAIEVKQEVSRAGSSILTKTEIVDKPVPPMAEGTPEHRSIVVEEEPANAFAADD